MFAPVHDAEITPPVEDPTSRSPDALVIFRIAIPDVSVTSIPSTLLAVVAEQNEPNSKPLPDEVDPPTVVVAVESEFGPYLCLQSTHTSYRLRLEPF